MRRWTIILLTAATLAVTALAGGQAGARPDREGVPCRPATPAAPGHPGAAPSHPAFARRDCRGRDER